MSHTSRGLKNGAPGKEWVSLVRFPNPLAVGEPDYSNLASGLGQLARSGWNVRENSSNKENNKDFTISENT